MKRVKFLSVFVFLLVGTLTVMAFTNHKYRKSSLATECLRYIGSQPLYASDTVILNVNNWTTHSGNPFPTPCQGGNKLCAICFDNSLVTPDEAREILWEYRRDNGGTYPGNGLPIVTLDGKVVWVYTKIF